MAIGTINGFNNDNNSDFKLTLSQYCLTLEKDETTTVTVTSPSDGKIYAISSDSNIVTASINNNIITVTALKSGSAIIHIGQSAGMAGNIYGNLTPEISALFINVPAAIEASVNDTNWEVISKVSIAGTGNQYWSIGDTKEIVLNGNIGNCFTATNLRLNIFILHFNYPVNNVADNNIIWGGFKDSNNVDVALVDSQYDNYNYDMNAGIIAFNYNHWGATSNFGGWKGCDLRYDILGATSTAPSQYGVEHTTNNIGYDATSATLTNPKANTLLAALSADFRSALRLLNRQIDAVGGKPSTYNIDANMQETIDAVSLLTEFEVTGTNIQANSCEQNYQLQMEYFQTGNSRTKYNYFDPSTRIYYCLASPTDDKSGCLYVCVIDEIYEGMEDKYSASVTTDICKWYSFNYAAIAPIFKT